ncbi:hypothetical protein [Clostridium sp. KNHs214]|uniref:hypothetical protein n=1 Tax=Clostridium sp. KNHs214 TaxID=1540257 RepID=UPI00054DEDF3|nr:hypothetical protein [Clostridium sp. KNHs214]
MEKLPKWEVVRELNRKDITKLVYDRLEELCEFTDKTIMISALEDRLSQELNLDKKHFLFVKFMFYLAEDLTELHNIKNDWWTCKEALDYKFKMLKKEYERNTGRM